MASTTHQLEALPLHLVGQILGHLDTIQDLGAAILSRSIFYSAFKENVGLIADGIMFRQIPESILPYAIMSLESKNIAPGDTAAIERLISPLCPVLHDPPELEGDFEGGFMCQFHISGAESSSPPSLSMLSLSDYAYLSREYAAVVSLRRSIFEDMSDWLNSFGLEHSNSLTIAEEFRIDRAFFLYQMVCNMFCLTTPVHLVPLHHSRRCYQLEGDEDIFTSQTEAFFSYFSPWVNEQVNCIYHFLEKRVVTVAFDHVASHDVSYAAFGNNDKRYREIGFTKKAIWSTNSKYCHRVQWFLPSNFEPLQEGLDPYHQFSKAADTLKSFPRAHHLRRRRLMYYTPEQLQLLSQPTDGMHDAVGSGSFRSWLWAHYKHDLPSITPRLQSKALYDCAYALWDFPDTSNERLYKTYKKIREYKTLCDGTRDIWPEEEVIRSENQRLGIYIRGGRGFWPATGIDFSKIYGLTDNDKEELMSLWKDAWWVKSRKRRRSSSSSSDAD
ncbi:hypothetical protein FSARC_10048 [Fusarium sarcochroum]|uniref:Uncharacterized protein n=1 Tax=Fusarium sarcochroum TaxID=1208366 RepID=A0A8H4X4P4_9HYPO|nr:hypothetical protein FSARC_10048 [Fusarium sarcochroum]